jgi:hypothetical protein
MYFINVFAFSMKIKAGAITNPATISHGSIIGFTQRISVWPRKANKMMVTKIDAI